MAVLNYVGLYENVVIANTIIANNCPAFGGWDEPVQLYNTELWRILKPGLGGYMDPNVSYTQAEMITGIDNELLQLQELEYNNSWDPPY